MKAEVHVIGDLTVVITEVQITTYRRDANNMPYDVKATARPPINAGTISPFITLNVGEGVIKAGTLSADKIVANALSSSKISKGTLRAGPPLFGSWIEKTKKLQEEWYGKDFENFTEQERVEWVRINILAATDELHEALAEISWKPWASASFFNRDAFLGEIVDVLHFIGNLLAGAGVTDAELNKAYDDKMQRNIKRQREGYTGTEKCITCKRAKDDVIAHGGTFNYLSDGPSPQCDSCYGGFKP